jgi:nickel transport protein
LVYYFRSIPGWIMAAAVSIALIFPAPASAHKVSIFAWVEGDVVHTQSRFMSNRIPETARGEVQDVAGRSLLQGSLDAEGKFSFTAPYRGEMKIILYAGPGHRAVWHLDADDFEMNRGAAVEGHGHSHPPDVPDRGSARVVLTEEKIVEMVTDLLREEIEPLKKNHSRSFAGGPVFPGYHRWNRLHCRPGGCGVAYIRSRRKPQGRVKNPGP